MKVRPAHRVLSALAAPALIGALVFLASTAAVAGDQNETIKGNSFFPENATVTVGDTITWKNTDPDTHSVVGGPMNSPDIHTGEQFTFTFFDPGEITYTCRFHPYMHGVVKVLPGKGGALPPAPMAPEAAKNPDIGAPLGDGTFLAKFTQSNGVKVFNLRMARYSWQTEPGVTKEIYAFNGIVPGPVIRVNEGDRVRIVVKNDLPVATGVHWHGMILPNSQDGVPGITQPLIHSGQTYTYEWTARATGTHWYHSHSSGDHIGKGLYGALEVVPKLGDIAADHDYRILVGDTNLGFVFNGKAFPATVPLKAKVGERVHIRLVDAGDQSHPIHLHGSPFQVVAQDGLRLPQPYSADTLTISTGQTYDIVTVPLEPGKWLLHCHIFAHSHMPGDRVMHEGSGMMGLVTLLDVAPGTSPLGTIFPTSPTIPGVTVPSLPVPGLLPQLKRAMSSDGLAAPMVLAVVVAFLAGGWGQRRRSRTQPVPDTQPPSDTEVR